MKVVGKAIPHESAPGHVSGGAVYTDDLVGRFSDVLHAWPVCAGCAHARVRSLDATRAEEVAGVCRVLTAEDVPGENDTGPARRDEPLFPKEVQYHGQPVAWVLAESEEAAREGAAAVTVDLEPLPAILSIEQAIDAGSFHTDAHRIRSGDAGDALVGAPHRLSGTVTVGGQEHFYLEAQAALAYEDEAGQVVVHSSTQHPSETQAIVARVLGRPDNEVTCQSLRMGGAFGGKEVQANAWAAVAALGSQRTGRPVRVRLDRKHDMIFTGKRHPFLGRFEVGFDAQGRLLALRLELFSDGGYSLDLSEPVLYRAMFHCDNAYRIPALEVTGRVCKTHKTSQTAFRGFGGPQGMVIIEDIVDRVARSVSKSPAEVRRLNFYREGDETHYGQPVKDAGRIEAMWDDVVAHAELERRQAEVDQFNAAHSERKRGLAITPVKFGISFTNAAFNQAGALVLVYKDGTVQVNHGGTEMGQGLHTKILQIAADALGVPMETIRLMPTRTDKVPNTSATAASSGSDLNGAAVRAACDQLRDRLSLVAARHFGCPEDLLEFASGEVFPAGRREDALRFRDVAERAYLQRVPLFAAGHYRTPGLHFDREKGRGRPFHYFAYGVAAAEVEIEAFTGAYRTLRVDILHDVGDSLSPLVDRGQIEGGFAQGAGWLTREELVWDDHGRLRTDGASTYKLPALDDCPEHFEVRLLKKAPEPGVVHGSKAVGEPPLMLAISVREALRAAVAAFGQGAGVVELPCPATPEVVFWAIEGVRAIAARSEAPARRFAAE